LKYDYGESYTVTNSEYVSSALPFIMNKYYHPNSKLMVVDYFKSFLQIIISNRRGVKCGGNNNKLVTKRTGSIF